MEQLKYKLFKVLSRTLSLEEFESWLYSDTYINDQILKNDLVLELVSMNFRSRQIMTDLDSFCFVHFDKEEILAAIVELNCEKYLQENSENSAENMINNICLYYNWDDDYSLISQFYWHREDWDLALEGCYSKNDIKNELDELVQKVIDQMSNTDIEGKKNILHEGIELEKDKNANSVVNEVNYKSRKWFQFWK